MNVCGVADVRKVTGFWKRKLRSDADQKEYWYVETSHFLARAGIVENLRYLRRRRHVHLVMMRADPFEVAWCLINQAEFTSNRSFTA